ATVHDGGQLVIDDAGVASGMASAPIELFPRTPARINILVTAPDRVTTKAYAVASDYFLDYLKASNTRTQAMFGSSVALSGDTLVVGSPEESSNAPSAGAVYVFTRTGTTWSQQAYLKASNTAQNAHFGASVALSGDTLVVGSPDA